MCHDGHQLFGIGYHLKKTILELILRPVSTEEIQEIVDHDVPVKTQKATKFGMSLFDVTYQLSFC